MADTRAKKEARDRWNDRNPSCSLHLPIEVHEKLKQIATSHGIGYHGLIKQILLDWLAKEPN